MVSLVVVCSGAYGEAWHYDRLVELAHHRWPNADIHVLAPAVFELGDWWAEYEPTPAEIHFQVAHRGCVRLCDAAEKASRYTLHANEFSMRAPLAHISGFIADRPGREVLVDGFSNGAALATAAASQVSGGVRGLWLASAPPTPRQSVRVLGGPPL